MLQVREAEERRDWGVGGRVHGADAHLDFLFGQFEIAGVRVPGKILVRPGMRADRHSGCDHLLGDFRMPGRVLADLKEGRLETLVGERLEHGQGVLRPGTVVEGQHHFLVAQEIILLEMLEAEPGPAGRIDFDDARKAHPARLVARRYAAGRRGGCGVGEPVAV